MNHQELKELWKQEEAIAHIHGWDFSHIADKYEEEHDIPWDYDSLVRQYLKKDMKLLDYDTGGLFITQQVGDRNDLDLVRMVFPDTADPTSGLHLSVQQRAFEQAGFEIVRAEEHFGQIRFYDVGAFVWFARIIEWEFAGFPWTNALTAC